ncbi:MAG: hypothetical protein GWP63_21300, partial [Haliea sp.]|nr:hypothetical protein [Haliea sp.]
MHVLAKLLKIVAVGICLLLVLLAAIIAWLWWSNRDIPMSELEARYGGNHLQRLEID